MTEEITKKQEPVKPATTTTTSTAEKPSKEDAGESSADAKAVEEESDVHFEPVVKLEKLDTIKTFEEEEETVFKMRSKLFRLSKGEEEGAVGEWKERGTGDMKILKHKETGKVRLLMRRDKTLKICANHYVTKDMEMKANIGSDRAWVWSTNADFAEEEPRRELFFIRFSNSENANKFKEKFEECQALLK